MEPLPFTTPRLAQPVSPPSPKEKQELDLVSRMVQSVKNGKRLEVLLKDFARESRGGQLSQNAVLHMIRQVRASLDGIDRSLLDQDFLKLLKDKKLPFAVTEIKDLTTAPYFLEELAGTDPDMLMQILPALGLDLTNEKEFTLLVTLLKKAAHTNIYQIHEQFHLLRFNLDNKKHLDAVKEIILSAAEDNGETVSHLIESFGIKPTNLEKTEALTEIAKACAKNFGKLTSQQIQKFGFDPKNPDHQKRLREILQIAGEGDLYQGPEYVARYGVYDSVLLPSLFRQFILQKLKVDFTLSSRDNWLSRLLEGFVNSRECIQYYKVFQNEDNPLENKIQTILEEIKKKAPEKTALISDQFNKLKEFPEKQESLLEWTVFILTFIELESLDPTSFNALLEIMQKPQNLRLPLTDAFLNANMNKTLSSLIGNGLEGKKRPLFHIALALSPFDQTGEIIQGFSRDETLLFLKDNTKLNPLLETLLLIKQNRECEGKVKFKVLTWLSKLPPNELIASAALLKSVVLLKAFDLLDEPLENLKSGFHNKLTDIFDVPKELLEKNFDNTLGQWRNLDALYRYAAKLTEEPTANQLLSQFVKQTLQGTFENERYSAKENRHLRRIEKKHLDVFNAWKQDVVLNPGLLGLPPSFKALETSDPNHFLLMGTEVRGSCQSVDGSPDLNKCLVGTMLDGKYRLLLILDSSGKILARSLIRLMRDHKKKPILFIETPYTANSRYEYENALLAIAKQKAKVLDLPLVFDAKHFPGVNGAKSFTSNLSVKDSGLPFEYVDALEGVQSPPYKIKGKDGSLVWIPKEKL